MRDWKKVKRDAFYRLVCGVVDKPPGDSPSTDFRARDVWEWQKGQR